MVAALASFAFSCDIAGEGDSLYKVSILCAGKDTSNTGAFSGMYLIDPEDSSNSWVAFGSTEVDPGNSSYEEYNLDIDFNTSISIFANGSANCTSLKLYFFINGSQKEFISDNAVYENNNIVTYASVELYYETTTTTTE